MSNKYPPPPAGLHRAVVSNVENDLLTRSKAYRMAKIDFSLLTMGCAGSRVSTWCLLAKASSEAKDFAVKQGRERMQGIFKAAGRPVGHPSTLSGAIVSVIVKHQDKDDGDGVWATVSDVLPDSQPDAPPSVPPEAPFSDDGLPF